MSLLSPVSHLVEKAITVQVIDHLESNNMLSDTIQGYRAHHSCETSVLELLESATEAQEEGNQFSLCLFDQSAEFDLMDFEILERKMEALNIEWYRNFLKNRHQYMYIEGAESHQV